MNAEAQRAFWVHYQSAEQHMKDLKIILPNLDNDLQAMARALKDEPLLSTGSLSYIHFRLLELAQYTDDIYRAVRQKRQDGEEADRRIDAMIGVVA